MLTRAMRFARSPVHYTMLFTVMHVICTASPSRSALGLVGLVISLGVGASMSFTVAHELVHSTDDTERTLLSAVLLLPNFYMHWGRAHVQHHAHVGTAKDPTTSRWVSNSTDVPSLFARPDSLTRATRFVRSPAKERPCTPSGSGRSWATSATRTRQSGSSGAKDALRRGLRRRLLCWSSRTHRTVRSVRLSYSVRRW